MIYDAILNAWNVWWLVPVFTLIFALPRVNAASRRETHQRRAIQQAVRHANITSLPEVFK